MGAVEFPKMAGARLGGLSLTTPGSERRKMYNHWKFMESIFREMICSSVELKNEDRDDLLLVPLPKDAEIGGYGDS